MYHNGDRKLILIIDLNIVQGHQNSRKIKKWNILWKYFYSLVPIIVVSTSNITGKNQVEKMYFVVSFLFSWFKWTTKSTNNRTRPLTIISQYQLTFKYEKWISSALHMKKCKSVPKNNFQSMDIYLYNGFNCVRYSLGIAL